MPSFDPSLSGAWQRLQSRPGVFQGAAAMRSAQLSNSAAELDNTKRELDIDLVREKRLLANQQQEAESFISSIIPSVDLDENAAQGDFYQKAKEAHDAGRKDIAQAYFEIASTPAAERKQKIIGLSSSFETKYGVNPYNQYIESKYAEGTAQANITNKTKPQRGVAVPEKTAMINELAALQNKPDRTPEDDSRMSLLEVQLAGKEAQGSGNVADNKFLEKRYDELQDALASGDQSAIEKAQAMYDNIEGSSKGLRSTEEIYDESFARSKGAADALIYKAGKLAEVKGTAEYDRVQDLANAAVKDEKARATMVWEMQDLVDKAQAAREGAEGNVGMMNFLFGKMPGSAQRDYASLIDSINSNLVLTQMKKLKDLSKYGSTGFGQMNEKEFKSLSDAVVKLDPMMSPPAFEEALGVIIDKYSRVLGAVRLGMQEPAVGIGNRFKQARRAGIGVRDTLEMLETDFPEYQTVQDENGDYFFQEKKTPQTLYHLNYNGIYTS